MINNLKPYPAYRDSGVPWLGQVPAHWEVVNLGRYIRVQSGDMISAEDERDAGVPIYGGNGIRGYTFKANTDGPVILLGRVGAKCGCVHLIKGRLWASEHALRVLPRTPVNLQFFARILDHANLNQYAIRTAQPLINSTIVRSHRIAVPPEPEQASIVGFLDHVDRRIRRYIRAKQQLIKLVEEQKQAIIHRAVTRGLDPNARLKPSGVEWLGDVPGHWEVWRNGQLFAQRNETGFAGLPILEVSLRTGIQVRTFEAADRKQVMSDHGQYKRAVKGDVAYNMMRMWQGAVGVAPVDGLVSPAYVVARPSRGMDSRYFSHLFRTPAYMREVNKYSRGIVKDRNRLYWEDFKAIPSPCPPAQEQVQIADAIGEDTRATGGAVDRAQRAIELVREWQSRLIADTVTGKLDVHEFTMALPDKVDDLELPDDTAALARDDAVDADSDTAEEDEA